MQGVHHLGLSVSDLVGSTAFFCDLLGWSKVREDPRYPAVFVKNDSVMITLWQTSEPSLAFDRKHHVGLHHVALAMDSQNELQALHQTLLASDHVEVEFGPELLRDGPSQHMMCREPSGVRVEFIWVGI